MSTERLTVIALPLSCADDAPVHVSLFISPTLTPDGAGGKLRDFEHFPRWPRVLATASEITLSDQDGAIEATALVEPLADDVWRKVFPPSTPVVAPAMPELRDRRWRTFPAAEVAAFGKLLHLATALGSPTDPPAPGAHVLAELATGLRRQYTGRDGRYDESLLTERFDRLIGTEPGRASLEPAQPDGRNEWFDRALLQLHRVRRFHERPEAQRTYQERPDPKAEPAPPLDLPKIDFHQRCAIAGDHPALLRALGLVIDLRVSDPARLRASNWLSAQIVPQGDTTASSPTRTRCRPVGDDLVTVAAENRWRDGQLRLGDEEQFQVLDVDADGTALKAERFLVSFPRLLVAEERTEPVNAATPALRATGLTVVQKQRAVDSYLRQHRQEALLAALGAGEAPELMTEDVVRGMQVEVWDATAREWFTLHARIVDIDAGRSPKPVLEGVQEHGFIQGAAVTETPGVDQAPVHLHEALFGWDGWSLSAPRPGKRIRHVPGSDNGGEVPEEVTTPDKPVIPLVIKTRVEPGTLPRLRFGRSYAFRAWAVDLAGNVRPHALGPTATEADDDLLDAVTAELAGRPPAVSALVAGATPSVREAITRRGRSPAPSASRSATVAETVRRALADDDVALLRPTARSAELLADVLTTATDATADVAAALDVVSPVVPFLRWEPVEPPAIVARVRFTPGESLRRLVVRSMVTQDPATLEVTVAPPAATSERHLAPPKTSQVQAELHGVFDEAIGSTDPDDHRRMLAWAVREKGSFFDVEVSDLDDPDQQHAQPGIALEREDDPPRTESLDLPLPAGELPAAGQYVVHDTDQLVLPYLPDPLARGVSFVFQEAGRDRTITAPFGVEGFTSRYGGEWPAKRPFRLVLRGGDDLRGEVDGDVIDVSLPPGDLQRFRLSSCVDTADLDLLGVWDSVPPEISSVDVMVESAADGWWWSLTPFEDVALVHAVSRPVEAPRTVVLGPDRQAGSEDCPLEGSVDVHAPSTESLTLEASWTDRVDDVTVPVPGEVSQRGVAFTLPVGVDEDLVLLGQSDDRAAIHRIGDTRHHVVDYRFRATTRFREYFDPAAIAAPAPEDQPSFGDDGRSVVGAVQRISVPSSAPPAAPVVHSVLPLFRWEDATEPEQPVGDRRTRRAGLRVYLERPWWSSGDGELLGVLVAPPPRRGSRRSDREVLTRYVSQWGQDPVWRSSPLPGRSMLFELEDPLRIRGLDDRPRDAAPVATLTEVRLATVPERPTVGVLGYQPAFNEARQLWYVDIALEPGGAFWPFVQLVVARYQPDSVDGCHLSSPVRCPYVPVPPERTTTVARPDVRTARVVVSGPVGSRFPERDADVDLELVSRNRTLVASLQRRDPAIPTDLGWETVTTTPLAIRGGAWVGDLRLPDDHADIPLVRPGADPDWRVTVEEWERLPGDPLPDPDVDPEPVWEQRLVFADELPL